MDRNTIIGIILIAAILIGYSIMTKPDREEIAERQRIADSLQTVKEFYELEKKKEAEMYQTQPGVGASEIADSIRIRDLGAFSSGVDGKEELYTLENELMKLVISSKGGRPKSVELKKYLRYDNEPIFLFDGDSSKFGLEFFSDGKSIKTNDLYFTTDGVTEISTLENSALNIKMRLQVGSESSFIEYSYTLHPDNYLVDYSLRMIGLDSYRTDNVQLAWEIYSPQQEMGRVNENNYTNLNYRYFEGDVEKFKQRSKKDVQDITETTKIHWVGFVQQFFSSIILADNIPFEGGYMASEQLPETSPYIRKFTTELSIPYNRTADFTMPMHFYFGPNHFQTLKNIGYELEDVVTLGSSIIKWINQYVVISLFNWLNRFISNYGIIILLLTLIIKIGLFPLTFRSYVSQAKMRVLKPQIDEINQKIPKEKALERQQATMALYKKVGVSPLGGCLPMLLQFPILFAMFRFFPASIELRQESFLWAHDLSTYDSILNLPFTIPFYGDHVSLFTILMTITTVLSMKMNTQVTADNSIPGMKTMMYIMPVMFMFILNSFSAGLTYYYFLANVITLGQNYLFKFFVDEEALLKKLNARKGKAPAGKSKFQQRLEDVAKKRGYKLPK
jgi:YidC/Oxa1 family membrane protein insertase